MPAHARDRSFRVHDNKRGKQARAAFQPFEWLRRKTDKQESWPTIAANMSQILDGRSQVEAAVLSPTGEYLAVCLETNNWLGLKTRQAGLLYAIRDHEAAGRIVTGKRGTEVWGRGENYLNFANRPRLA
jgi:hypothetical protein